jgi:hypothetical protein
MARDEIWDELKDHGTEKFNADRQRFLEEATSDDDGNWTKHDTYHWSRTVNGKRLDYWPSRKKWQYDGKVKRGLKSMYALIRPNKP